MGQADSKLDQLRQVADVREKELWKWKGVLERAAPDGILLQADFVKVNQKLRGGSASFWADLFHSLDTKSHDFISTRRYLLLVAIMSDHCTTTTASQLDWAFTLFAGREELSKAEFANIINTLNGCGDLISVQSAGGTGPKTGRRTSATPPPGARKLKRSNATLQLPHVNADVLFQEIDVNGDGKLSRQEFVSHCTQCSDLVDLLSGLLHGLHTENDEQWERKRMRRTATAFGLETFGAQVAGHGSEGPSPDSMLQCDSDNSIWKPLSYNEFAFYEQLYALAEDIGERGELAMELKDFCSEYMGRNFLVRGEDCWQYIVLENLTAGFLEPCIIDLKMGTQGHGDDASLGKVLQQKFLVQATTSASLGFRLCGMRVFQGGEGYLVRSKKWGAMSVKKSTMDSALNTFFSATNSASTRLRVLELALEKLRAILAWFERQFLFRFYSSSLLIIYDGAAKAGAEPKVRVAMVDFAHVHPIKGESGTDKSYIFGLQNLIAALERIAAKEAPQISAAEPELERVGIRHLHALSRVPSSVPLDVLIDDWRLSDSTE